MSQLYYTEPLQESFEDMKSSAIEIWNQYDNTYGYVDEKVNQIKDIKNIKDNFMYIFAMFDMNNQFKLVQKLKPHTRVALRDRLFDVEQGELVAYLQI